MITINIHKYATAAMIMAISLSSCGCKRVVPKGISINVEEGSSCITSLQTSTTETTTITTMTTKEMNTTTTTAVTSSMTETMTTTEMMNTTTEVLTSVEFNYVPTTTEEIVYCDITTGVSSAWLSREFEGTYYVGRMMGYTSQPYGASGNLLVNGYSVASNYFPFGTHLYIESDYISGEFVVDDCGGMTNNVIDFYFWDISNVPYAMAQVGRFPITVMVIN